MVPRGLRGAARGSAAAEFAVVLPFLLLLILGIFQLVLVFAGGLVVEKAAFDAARAEAAGADPAAAAEIVVGPIGGWTGFARDTRRVPGIGVLHPELFGPEKVRVNVLRGLSDVPDAPGTVTAEDPAVEVEVVFDYELIVPVVNRLAGIFETDGTFARHAHRGVPHLRMSRIGVCAAPWGRVPWEETP